MALVWKDRVMQTTLTVGKGNLVLSGLIPGFKDFDSHMSLNDTFYGVVYKVDPAGRATGEWETGLFTKVAANTLQRTTVGASSAGAKQKTDFTAGTKYVVMCPTAAYLKSIIAGAPPSTGVEPSPSAMPTGIPGAWALTFEDTFETGSSPDAAKWVTGGPLGDSNASNNTSVASGLLHIWPQVDASGNFFSRAWMTNGKFTQTYGAFEIEMRMPVGAGLEPSIGLFGAGDHMIRMAVAQCGAPSGDWASDDMHPLDYQIGYFENFSGGAVDTQRIREQQTIPDLSLDFHKYGLLWTPTEVTFYFDGVQAGTPINHGGVMNTALYMYLALRMVYDNEVPPTVGSGPLTSGNQYTPQGISNAMQVNYARAWTAA